MGTQHTRLGRLVGGSALIGLGVLVLLGQWFNFMTWQALWPLIIVGIGGLFFVGMLVGGKPAAGLAITGSLIGMIGLLLLYQNFTGHWNSWAYGWTIIPMAVGLGLWIAGLWSDNAHQRRSGWRLMQVSLVSLLIFGAFFELMLSGFGGSALAQALFPVMLILLGLYLVVRRSGLWPSQPAANPTNPSGDQTSTPPSRPPQA